MTNIFALRLEALHSVGQASGKRQRLLVLLNQFSGDDIVVDRETLESVHEKLGSDARLINKLMLRVEELTAAIESTPDV